MTAVSHPVYLVRHGQSQWNVLRRTQGQTVHPPLTRLGRAQAEAAASLIAEDLTRGGHRVGRVVSSDLVRATQTAEVIGARLGLDVVTDRRLREQHLGGLEGKSYAETWAAAESHDWSDPSLPLAGGESLLDVRERMGAVLDGLDGDTATVLVSHGDAIRAAVAHLRGEDAHEATWIEVQNGAVARIDGAVTWLT
jgi:probable phosphoglycerate mutase